MQYATVFQIQSSQQCWVEERPSYAHSEDVGAEAEKHLSF